MPLNPDVAAVTPRRAPRRRHRPNDDLRRRVGRRGALLVGLVLAPLAAAGVARACVPQPLVTLEPHASGAPGSRVGVHGLRIGPAVEVRWNGTDGPLLGTAMGPEFTVQVEIPQVPAGLYVLTTLVRQQDGQVGTTVATAFAVSEGAAETGRPAETAPSTRSPASSTAAGWTSAPAAVLLGGGMAAMLLSGLIGGAMAYRLAGRRGAGDHGPGRRAPGREHEPDLAERTAGPR